MRDDDVRAACFAALDVLRAQLGDELPYARGLARGFAYRGTRVPFLSYQKGIDKAAAQGGPAALSIQTSANSPYGDAPTEAGFRRDSRTPSPGPVPVAGDPAYREQCAVCRLKEIRLLDAAHILGDREPAGEPMVSNGLNLCTIHHRAYDQNLVGVAPDYRVHVSRRLLEDEDGPMLTVLKTFQGKTIEVPARRAWQPDRELLAQRFDRFRTAA